VAEPEPMTLSERRKYLHLLQPSYRSAKRRGRSQLLDEAERVTGRHRKTLIRLLRSDLERKPRARQRGRAYGPQVEYAVRLVARTLDFPCAERLQPALVSTASSLAAHGELVLSADLLERLERISISTVGRMVQRMRRDGHQPRLARTRPSPPNPLTRSIPAGRLPRHLPGPGYFEADLVHHAGDTTAGQYVHTLQLIDVATGWSERVAILGRSYTVMHTVPVSLREDAFERILARLPFPILELHPDNGGEFFNRFLLTYWKQAVPHLTLSRSRPFHKNDNPLVEEKNGSLVRGYIGFARLDTVAQTNLLNQIYDRMWLLHNFFHPVMRQQGDVHPTAVRHYDRPVPAFDRLSATAMLPPERQEALASLRLATNPLQLRNEVHSLLDRLSHLPNARPGKPQDVHRTLFEAASCLPATAASVTLSIEGSTAAR
jgi:hypothetical protein